MAICAIAILAPTIVLFWMQYRSLDQLRAKTRIAVQDSVRQRLERFRHGLENRTGLIASDSLQQFQMAELGADHLPGTGAKFREILEKYRAVSGSFSFPSAPAGVNPTSSPLPARELSGSNASVSSSPCSPTP
jgi:hypothetical protein